MAISTKMAKLREWRILQESVNGLAKTKMRRQRGESRQIANFGIKGEYANNSSGFGKIFK